MNDPSELESMLHSLRPGALPQDLRQRLAVPPAISLDSRRFRRPFLIGLASLAAAAVVVLLLHRPAATTAPSPPLSVHHQESTLIGSRVLGYVERDGRVWCLEDRQWRDDEQAFCSNSDVSVSLSRQRHELAYKPVSFD